MKLIDKYQFTRRVSEELCKPLEIEDYVPQPVEFVSPPKWNLGHTTWFFEEMVLKKFIHGYTVFDSNYNYLFNSYYQSLGDRVKRANRGDLSRPTVSEVYKYRTYVDSHMYKLIENGAYSDEMANLIIIGLNHEEQHQELFYSDLKFTFSLNPIFPVYNAIAMCEKGDAGEADFITINSGLYEVGFEGESFSYDNESPRHQVFLNNYSIATKLVSNAEYLEFLESGGYQNPDYWHDDAWSWLKSEQIDAPMYWVKMEDEWHQYTLAGLKVLNPNSPVTHINYYEAFAFAQWKGMRLPTEFEWEVASDQFNWGDRWEWTESAYLPYPGYKKPQGALGEYNGKFMVNQKVLRGSSVATSKGHERKTYRNFFHPKIGYQFNGIRLAK